MMLALYCLAAVAAAPAAGPAWVEGEVLVELDETKPAAEVLRRLGATDARALGHHLHQVHVGSRGLDTAAALSGFAKVPGVRRVQPSYVYVGHLLPNDPLLPVEWALSDTGQAVTASRAAALEPGFRGWWDAPAAEALTPGASADIEIEPVWSEITDCRTNASGAPVVVAVLDSGINYDHPDLAANLWDGGDAFPHHGANALTAGVDGDLLDPLDPMDQAGHGTTVAGAIGAVGDDGRGTSGVCWRASMMAVKVANRQNHATTADLVVGLDFAVEHGARVVNISMGAQIPSDPALEAALDRARSAGVLVVTSAGNSATNDDETPVYPCAYAKTLDNVLCVTSVDRSRALAGFAAYGATTVGLAAPGVNIVSTADGAPTVRSMTSVAGGRPRWTTNPVGPWAYLNVGVTASFPGAGLAPEMDYVLGLACDDSTHFLGYARNVVASVWSGRGYAIPSRTPHDALDLCFIGSHALARGDRIDVAYAIADAPADPFAGSPTVVGTLSGTANSTYCFGITPCLDRPCDLGLQLTSGPWASPTDGAAITHLKLVTRSPDTAETSPGTTNVSSGTSLSAPLVAGVAALLFAYNGSDFGYLDAVRALLRGGRPAPALAGKTVSGAVLSAKGSLGYLAPPANVRARVVEAEGP